MKLQFLLSYFLSLLNQTFNWLKVMLQDHFATLSSHENSHINIII